MKIYIFPSWHKNEEEADEILHGLNGLSNPKQKISVLLEMPKNETVSKLLNDLERHSIDCLDSLIATSFPVWMHNLFSMLSKEKQEGRIMIFPIDVNPNDKEYLEQKSLAEQAESAYENVLESSEDDEEVTSLWIKKLRTSFQLSETKNMSMLKNIELFLENSEALVFVIVGALHAIYLKKHLEQEGHSVVLVKSILCAAELEDRARKLACDEKPPVDEIRILFAEANRSLASRTGSQKARVQ